MVIVLELSTLVAMFAFRLSTAFWRHSLVDMENVSALTVPVVVIVENDIPVPAATDVTVPEDPDGIA